MSEVWMSTLRRGNAYHLRDGHRTPCGLFIGMVDGQPLRGDMVEQEWAVEHYFAVPCKRCSGEATVVKPRAGRRAR